MASPSPSPSSRDRGALRGVLLDVDGTLLLSNQAHAEAFAIAFRESGRDIPAEHVRPLIGMGSDKLLPSSPAREESDGEVDPRAEKEAFSRSDGVQAAPARRRCWRGLRDRGSRRGRDVGRRGRPTAAEREASRPHRRAHSRARRAGEAGSDIAGRGRKQTGTPAASSCSATRSPTSRPRGGPASRSSRCAAALGRCGLVGLPRVRRSLQLLSGSTVALAKRPNAEHELRAHAERAPCAR